MTKIKINVVLILLKQSKDESSKHSNLKSENISKDLNKCTKEQRKTDAEGKSYSFKAYECRSM